MMLKKRYKTVNPVLKLLSREVDVVKRKSRNRHLN